MHPFGYSHFTFVFSHQKLSLNPQMLYFSSSPCSPLSFFHCPVQISAIFQFLSTLTLCCLLSGGASLRLRRPLTPSLITFVLINLWPFSRVFRVSHHLHQHSITLFQLFKKFSTFCFHRQWRSARAAHIGIAPPLSSLIPIRDVRP